MSEFNSAISQTDFEEEYQKQENVVVAKESKKD